MGQLKAKSAVKLEESDWLAERTLIQDAMDHLEPAMSVFDGAFRLAFYNQKFVELLEFPEDFVEIGRPFEDFLRFNAARGEYGPGDTEALVRERMILAEKREPHRFERVRDDGTVVEVRGNPLPGGGFVTTYTDITERKRAEDARRESEERYRNLVELSPDSILVHRDGTILYANPAAAALVGAAGCGQLVGERLDAFVHPDSESLLADRLQTLGEEGKTLALTEYKVIDLDGNTIVVDAVAGPITLDGKPAVQSVLRDITDRRRAEDRLYGAIDSVGEGFALFDADDRLVLFNREYLRLHPDNAYMIKPGMLFEDFVRERVRRGMNADAIDCAEAHIRERMAQHRNPTGPIVRTLTDGTTVVIKESRTPDGGVVVTETDITERKQAEEALRQSEEQYRLVTDALPATILYLDTDLRYRFVNKHAETWFGRPAHEIIGQRSIDLLGAEQFEKVRPQVEATLKGEFVNSETVLTHPDGRTRTIAFTFVPDFDVGGEIKGYFVLGFDITERKEAEQALKQSESLLNSVIDNVPVGLLLKDPDHIVVRANSTYLDWYGFDRDSMNGIRSDEIEEFQSADEVAAMNGQEREVLTTGKTLTRQVERPFSDGQQHTVRITKFPVFDQQGNVIMVGSASVDLTEQVQARQELRKSEIRFRDFAETASDWLWEMDESFRFTYVSERYREITGHDPSQHIGRTRLDLTLQPPTDEKWQRHLDDLKNRRSFREFEYDLAKSNGDVLNVSISGQPVYDENSNFRGYRGTGRDITEQRSVELARDAALNEAIEANEAKSKFLANLSHEFRTPLNAILGFSEILNNKIFGPLGAEKYEEYADDIFTSSEHLLELINDLLDISAIESGKTILHKEEVSGKDIVNSCMQALRQLPSSNGKDFKLDIRDDLPRLYADKKAVKQVLLNLISNAVKFTPDGGTITVAASATKEHIRFMVSDTGIGISAEQLPNVTSPFVKGEQDPYRYEKGWGLGLSISKSLVELHNGKLDIESTPGSGTTVTALFPRHHAGDREPSRTA